MTICARSGCERQARGDEYCSVFCAKIDFGLITEEEDKLNAREARRLREEIRVEVENTSVNRPRHVGPAKHRVRRTSG